MNRWDELKGYIRTMVRVAIADQVTLDEVFVANLARETHGLHTKTSTRVKSRGLEEAHKSQLSRYENMVTRAIADLS